MVRKAVTLTSVDELALLPMLKHRLDRRDLQELVYLARTNRLDIRGTNKNYTDEVVDALDQAGFIRHDFTPASFATGRLYRAVDPAKYHTAVGSVRDFTSNRHYENYCNLSDRKLQLVMHAMQNQLGTHTTKIMAYLLGWDSPGKMTLQSAGQKYGVSRSRIGQIYKSAIARLRKKPGLPEILPESELSVSERLISMKAELARLREDPVFEMERRLISEIRELALDYPDEAQEEAVAAEAREAERELSVDYLRLSTRARNCLIRIGVRTVGELADLVTSNEFAGIRGIGALTVAEVTQKLHEFNPNLTV